jgi:hypothetical protein
VPVIDWWRRTGLPEEMRPLLGALAGEAHAQSA